MTAETSLIFAVFVLLVLQLVVIALLARQFASKQIEQTVERVGEMLRTQTNKQSATLEAAVESGTQAAHAAFTEAAQPRPSDAVQEQILQDIEKNTAATADGVTKLQP